MTVQIDVPAQGQVFTKATKTCESSSLGTRVWAHR